jgi:hypothetical protein
MNLCQSLFVLVLQVLGVILKLFCDCLQSFGVISRQFYFLPQVLRGVRSLDSLDVQIADTVDLLYRGVPTVRKGARTAIAESADIVFVATEILQLALPLAGLQSKDIMKDIGTTLDIGTLLHNI